MPPNASQIVITTEEWAFNSIHLLCVHHRGFPEVRGEGSSTEDAAVRLLEHLSRTLDNAPSDWRRETLTLAIEDVRAFAVPIARNPLRSSGCNSEMNICFEIILGIWIVN